MHHSIINSRDQIKTHTLSDLTDGCAHASSPVQESWWSSKVILPELHTQTKARLNKYNKVYYKPTTFTSPLNRCPCPEQLPEVLCSIYQKHILMLRKIGQGLRI